MFPAELANRSRESELDFVGHFINVTCKWASFYDFMLFNWKQSWFGWNWSVWMLEEFSSSSKISTISPTQVESVFWWSFIDKRKCLVWRKNLKTVWDMQLLNRNANVRFNLLYDLPLVLVESSLSSSGCLDFLVASSSAKKSLFTIK